MKSYFIILVTFVALLVLGYIAFQPALFPKKTTGHGNALSLTHVQTNLYGKVTAKNTDGFVMDYVTSIKTYSVTVLVSPQTIFTYLQSYTNETLPPPTFGEIIIGQHVNVLVGQDIRTMGATIPAKEVQLPTTTSRIQGMIQKFDGTTLTILSEHPYPDNGAVQQTEYLVVVPRNKPLTKRSITFGEKAPTLVSTSIDSTGIQAGMTIDCVVRTTNPQGTVGTLLSGTVTAM